MNYLAVILLLAVTLNAARTKPVIATVTLDCSPKTQPTTVSITYPVGWIGASYVVTFQPQNGTPPYRIEATTPLPPGLVLDPYFHLSGVPSVKGTWPVSIVCKDATTP